MPQASVSNYFVHVHIDDKSVEDVTTPVDAFLTLADAQKLYRELGGAITSLSRSVREVAGAAGPTGKGAVIEEPVAVAEAEPAAKKRVRKQRSDAGKPRAKQASKSKRAAKPRSKPAAQSKPQPPAKEQRPNTTKKR